MPDKVEEEVSLWYADNLITEKQLFVKALSFFFFFKKEHIYPLPFHTLITTATFYQICWRQTRTICHDNLPINEAYCSEPLSANSAPPPPPTQHSDRDYETREFNVPAHPLQLPLVLIGVGGWTCVQGV